MDILFLDYFRDSSFDNGNMYHNLSEYCNRIDSEIKLYSGNEYAFFENEDKLLTFPNVVYVDRLYLDPNSSTKYTYPDLKEVGRLFISSLEDMDDLGFITTIHFFVGLDYLLHPQRKNFFFPKLTCELLGDKMYRFTSEKGSWDIRINGYY